MVKYEFLKLEIRLINDPRFFRLSEFEQLVYLKLLVIAKLTNNRIYKDMTIIKDLLRTERPLSDLKVTIKRLRKTFPKFKSCKHFYSFDGFEDRLTYFRQSKSKSKSKIEEEEEDKERAKAHRQKTKDVIKDLRGTK